MLDREELRTLEPALSGTTAGGILVHSDMHVRPETLCSGLVAELRRSGVELAEGFEVERFGCSRNRIWRLEGSAGTVEAEAVVLAAGAETGRLAGALGHPLPVQAGKGYSITVENPRAAVSRPVHLAGEKIGFTPFGDAIRVLGTMELSGINRRLDRRRIDVLERAARRTLPGALEGGRRIDWVGMRPVTPDGLPIIGRLRGVPNVVVATGHQMLGVTLAPVTGRAVAAALLGRPGEISDLAAFDPARFDRRRSDRRG